jgi:hypothetical protein
VRFVFLGRREEFPFREESVGRGEQAGRSRRNCRTSIDCFRRRSPNSNGFGIWRRKRVRRVASMLHLRLRARFV